jgi:molybdenum-dependent DNA-binding transcriptional regulator ModE
METEKSSNNSGDGMNTASPKSLLADLCGPREIHDSRESWLRRGARLAGLSYRQAKSIFYGEIRNPEHRAVRAIRETLEREQTRRNGAHHDTPAELAGRLRILLDRHDETRREIARLLADLDIANNSHERDGGLGCG